MEYISLSKASVLIGKSKSTVLEYIRNGKLEAEKNNKGVYNISKDELFRVFALNGSERTEKRTNERSVDVAILQERLAAEQALRKSVEDERDFLREQVKEASAERRILNNRLSFLLENRIVEEDIETVEVGKKEQETVVFNTSTDEIVIKKTFSQKLKKFWNETW
jgi:hypothetical protein